jgi:type IV secretion system protein VirB6
MKLRKFFNIFLILICCVLTSCDSDICIDPDDFGFIKFSSKAYYKKEDLESLAPDNQVAKWVDTNVKLNGDPLLILVRTWDQKNDKNSTAQLSAWCPWYGNGLENGRLAEICTYLPECRFINDQMCSNKKEADIGNAPCIFKNGVGLYMLVSERYSDPNATMVKMRAPNGLTFHVGEKLQNPFYELNRYGKIVEAGGLHYIFSRDEKARFEGTSLYSKILDRYYDDNSGQYRLVIKSGVRNNTADPLEFVTNLIKEHLFGDKGMVKAVYHGIITNNSYKTTITFMLSLYIIFTSLGFLTGNVEITQTEFIIRILKIGLISTLMSSENSWKFFHDYLFVFFVEGLESLLEIVKQSSTSGSGSTSIINLMIAPQTMSKLFSLLFTDWLGFIYILLFMIALYFIFMMIFKATVTYLTALITIGMIIIMAPIFISFMLFGFTKSLFENWLKQLISYAIQPLILFLGISFIAMIVRGEIYSSLGFGVCKKSLFDFGSITDLVGSLAGDDEIFPDGNSLIAYPFPVKFTQKKANILVPMDHVDKNGRFCAAYECMEERYIELPYLDPQKELDQRRINNFFNGKFVQLDGLWLIFLSIYLLSKFNTMAISIASFIGGTSGNLTSLSGAAGDTFAPIQSYADKGINKAYSGAKSAVNRRVIKPVVGMIESTKLGGFVVGGVKGIADGSLFQDYMEGRLKEQAILSPNKAIEDEVKRKFGLSHEDVKGFKKDEREVDKKKRGGFSVINKYRDAVDDATQNLNFTKE